MRKKCGRGLSFRGAHGTPLTGKEGVYLHRVVVDFRVVLNE